MKKKFFKLKILVKNLIFEGKSVFLEKIKDSLTEEQKDGLVQIDKSLKENGFDSNSFRDVVYKWYITDNEKLNSVVDMLKYIKDNSDLLKSLPKQLTQYTKGDGRVKAMENLYDNMSLLLSEKISLNFLKDVLWGKSRDAFKNMDAKKKKIVLGLTKDILSDNSKKDLFINGLKKVSGVSDPDGLYDKIKGLHTEMFNDFAKEIRDKLKGLTERENYDIVYDENNILIVAVYDYKTSQMLGCTSDWCVTKTEGAWDKYSSQDGQAHFIYDFNVDPSNSKSLFAVYYSNSGGIRERRDKKDIYFDVVSHFKNLYGLNIEEYLIKGIESSGFGDEYNLNFAKKQFESDGFLLNRVKRNLIKFNTSTFTFENILEKFLDSLKNEEKIRVVKDFEYGALPKEYELLKFENYYNDLSDEDLSIGTLINMDIFNYVEKNTKLKKKFLVFLTKIFKNKNFTNELAKLVLFKYDSYRTHSSKITDDLLNNKDKNTFISKNIFLKNLDVLKEILNDKKIFSYYVFIILINSNVKEKTIMSLFDFGDGYGNDRIIFNVLKPYLNDKPNLKEFFYVNLQARSFELEDFKYKVKHYPESVKEK